jgi:hypothetical protein
MRVAVSPWSEEYERKIFAIVDRPPWRRLIERLRHSNGRERASCVQRMLGHAFIKLAVDLYGSWLPMTGRGRIGWMRAEAVAKW